MPTMGRVAAVPPIPTPSFNNWEKSMSFVRETFLIPNTNGTKETTRHLLF